MDKQSANIGRPSITSRTGEEYVPSSKIRSAADIERAAAGVIDVDAKTTTYVVLACIIAASGGVLFGYDGGVTGECHLPPTCTCLQVEVFCRARLLNTCRMT